MRLATLEVIVRALNRLASNSSMKWRRPGGPAAQATAEEEATGRWSPTPTLLGVKEALEAAGIEFIGSYSRELP